MLGGLVGEEGSKVINQIDLPSQSVNMTIPLLIGLSVLFIVGYAAFLHIIAREAEKGMREVMEEERDGYCLSCDLC